MARSRRRILAGATLDLGSSAATDPIRVHGRDSVIIAAAGDFGSAVMEAQVSLEDAAGNAIGWMAPAAGAVQWSAAGVKVVALSGEPLFRLHTKTTDSGRSAVLSGDAL